MERRRWMGTMMAMSLALLPLSARAEGVTVVRGQFTDRVERSRPVGDASAIGAGATAYYWLQVENTTGQPTQVTLIWRLDGREVHRAQLEISAQRRMNTWAWQRVRRARAIAVEVLDASGASLHSDQATVGTQ